jgi:hypothetical protein
MNEGFVNPTYYNLQKATIRTEFGQSFSTLDITALIPSITLTSSIESETMFGSARVIDSVGLLEETPGRDPLRGEEQIIFEIADSKTINENGGIGAQGTVAEPYKFVGFIYKIDNVQTKGVNDGMTYDIHFVSYQSFRANTYELIRSFIDEKISDVANTIFTDYYQSTETLNFIPEDQRKRLILEPTDGLYRCTIPKMRPDETMDFLARRSYSVTSPSCLFRFFESSRAFHYVTDEKLYRLANDAADPDYDETRNFNFTYLDAIPNTLEYFDAQINNLEVIENTDRVNSFDDIFSGAYRNKVYALDILSRRLNLVDDTNQYDYLQSGRFQDAPGSDNVIRDRHTYKFIRTVHRQDSPQKKWLVVQNYTEGERSGINAMQAETYYPVIISNRQSYSKHVESIVLSAQGPGRLDITAGDMVTLEVKEFRMTNSGEDGSFEPNKRLTGEYIVKTVTHNMERDKMSNSYVLIKRNWGEIETIETRGERL